MASKAMATILLLLAVAAAIAMADAAKRAVSPPMPSRSVGARVKRSSKSSTSSMPAAVISITADAPKSAAPARIPSIWRSVGAGGNERSSAPETCVSSLLDLSPCLAFFKDAGATAAPAGCCAGLQTIIDTQPVCLCHIVNHTLERAIGVDIPIDRAFTLLGDICRLTPPQEVFTSCGNKGKVPPLYVCPAPSA